VWINFNDSICPQRKTAYPINISYSSVTFFFFFKQKTAYEIGLGIPAEPLFRSMQQQDNHEYPFLYQRQTCHQVQPNQATYQKRQKCQPATYLQEVLYQL